MFFSNKNRIFVIVILIVVDLFIWQAIVRGQINNTELYFLDVGQGDSQLIRLPGNVKILIDGGADAKILGALAKTLPLQDRYIDLIVITHPQLDHFGGLIDVLKNYEVGAIIDNGRPGTVSAYADLEKTIVKSGALHVSLKEGDVIKYIDKTIKVLSPSPKNLKSDELNDTSLVIMLEDGLLKALYAGDIGFDVESRLVKKYKDYLGAQVLKVPHHGSKFSSGSSFLRAVSPKIAVIEVGKNRYGHPTKQTLQRLAQAGAAILRTDTSGIIKLVFDGQKLSIYR
ncbi:MAG: MBL fold metallo-hydrolase [bacterium]|nr:MBL fold metallo-hydrolase [bacterium]